MKRKIFTKNNVLIAIPTIIVSYGLYWLIGSLFNLWFLIPMTYYKDGAIDISFVGFILWVVTASVAGHLIEKKINFKLKDEMKE